METKVKKFSHKLLALFLALVMAITCFSGVLTSYARSDQIGYVDDDVEYNDIAWNILSDEQLATAILDYADSMLPILKELEGTLAAMVDGMKISVLTINWSTTTRQITLKALGSTWVTITVKLGSVDELMETLESVNDVLHGSLLSLVQRFGLDIGQIGDIDLGATNGLRRTKNTSCEIVRGVLGLIYDNLGLIDSLVQGTLDLGIVNDMFNVYDFIGGLFDAPSGYQTSGGGFIYNIVQSILFKYTKWFDDVEANGNTEKENYLNGTKTFVYDDVLLDKMTNELLVKINAEITYKGTDKDNTVSSKVRYAEIKAKAVADGTTFRQAAAALGYDPDIVYTNDGNVYLFVYGTNADGSLADDAQKISINTSSTLFSFGYEALDLAWKTALKDTVNTVRVNYDVERGHGSNFDNTYYYWAKANLAGGWDTTNLPAMYSRDNLIAWADAPTTVSVELKDDQYVASSGIVFPEEVVTSEIVDGETVYTASTTTAGSYGAKDATEFLEWVEDNYRFDRTVASDAEGTWADIDEETLFNKLRYSPLADYAFDIQTGPINLYFMQTGVTNLEGFFNNYHNYTSLVSGLNDCLVAAVKDIFVDRDNIYVDEKGDTSCPEMTLTTNSVNQATTISDAQKTEIANTLVSNALKIVQYTADTTDKNILNGFYSKGNSVLTEENLETAMIPLLVACIGQINIEGKRLQDLIHPDDWDKCTTAEAVAFVCLREYLSFALPQKDYNVLVSVSDGAYNVDFDGAIMPMARDALIYVIEPYVPVTDKNGNRWTADTDYIDTNPDNSIFDLLNSVLCYYATFYTSWDYSAKRGSSERGLGAGALLGLVNASGNDLISRSNTIWQNIDIAINKIIPVIGTLQGEGYGNANSYNLIYRDIIQGVLNIGTAVNGTNMCGVSNFLYRLLTIVSAEPIQTTPLVTTVYNLLKDLINGVAGPRYTNQTWVPVPNASSLHPFDDFFKSPVIAGNKNNTGAIHKLLGNVIEFSGYGGKGIATYPDTILPGLTFAVSAVNSFFNFLPFIGEHTLKLATAEYNPSAITGAGAGSSYNKQIVITNNAVGINTAYIDGTNDNSVEQNSRYYIQVTGLTQRRSDLTTETPVGFTSDFIAPGDSKSFNITTSYSNISNNSCSYIATVTYSIYLKDGNSYEEVPGCTGLTTCAYQFLTGATSWYDSVYPSSREQDGIRRFPEALEGGAGETKGTAPNTTTTTRVFGTDNNMRATYPDSIVVSTNSLSTVNSMGLRIRNDQNTDRSVDGVYFYDDKYVNSNLTTGTAVTQNDDTRLTNVQVTKKNAIPLFDKTTGDLLHMGYYDIAYDNTDNWDRSGYNETAIADLMQAAKNEGREYKIRDHVAYTLQEALDAHIIAAYYVNSLNEYEYMYLTPDTVSYDTLLANITMRGPVDGIYINTGKFTATKSATTYISPLTYDGTTEVKAGTYPCNINFYTSNNNNGTGTINFIVADTGNASELSNKYNEMTALLSNYRQNDFTDFQNGKSAVYEAAQSALLSALSAQSTVLNSVTASSMADTTALLSKTKITTSQYGDKAYVPYSTSNDSTLPQSIKDVAYVGGSIKNGVQYGGVSGIYYLDPDCTIPLYSNTQVTRYSTIKTINNVRHYYDAAGVEIAPVTEGGSTTYYLVNTQYMEREWNTTAYDYAWYGPTNVQATDDEENPLYEQVQFVYRDANGDKVNSGDDWVCKLAETETRLVENTGEGEDNRGIYTQAIDALSYAYDNLNEALDTTIAKEELMDNVSVVREGLNENNFDIITFNKMVECARAIEDLYNVKITYTAVELDTNEDGSIKVDENGNAITKVVTHKVTVPYDKYKNYRDNVNITITDLAIDTELSSVQVTEYKRLFDTAMGQMIERGYLGNQLEAEIECAAGGAYDDFTVTEPVRDENGNIVTNGTVSSTAVAAPEFGAYVDGNLVNAGDVIYPQYLWNKYINALSEAVALAQFGNSDDNYFAERDRYLVDFKDLYEAQVVDCYNADTALQMAEIALENVKIVTIEGVEGGSVTVDGTDYTTTVQLAVTNNDYITIIGNADSGYNFKGFIIDGETVEVEPNEDGEYAYSFKVDTATTVTPIFRPAADDGVVISGKVTIAATADGEDSGFGLREVTIYANPIVDDYGRIIGGEIIGVTNSEGDRSTYGNFTVTVPAGTTTIGIKGASTVDRIIAFNATAPVDGIIIPVAICDYNRDTSVNAADFGEFIGCYSGSYNVFADYNADNLVNVADFGVFLNFYSAGAIDYSELSID